MGKCMLAYKISVTMLAMTMWGKNALFPTLQSKSESGIVLNKMKSFNELTLSNECCFVFVFNKSRNSQYIKCYSKA